MSFFSRFFARIKASLDRKRKQDQWANRFNQPPAQPKNPLPLDNDPWNT